MNLFGGMSLPFTSPSSVLKSTMINSPTTFGVQLFTIPSMVDRDLEGTLKIIAEIGYRQVEFFGPYPFSDPTTIARWEGLKSQLGLNNNAFYGYTPDEVASMLDNYGLQAPSFHVDLPTLRNHLDRMAKELAKLKARYLVLPAVMESRESLSDYQKLASEFNEIGKKLAAFGMKLVYHNHGYEHSIKSGKVPFEVLLAETDPAFVQFELDVFWMKAARAEPVEYLQKYTGRFVMMHLKDAEDPFVFSGDGGTPDQWMAGFPKMADPGDGVYDIEGMLRAGKASGVQYFFLERDLAPSPMDTLSNSFINLSSMI